MSTLDGATEAPAPNVFAATPGEFAARWNSAPEEQRQRWLAYSQESMLAADRCRSRDHEQRLEHAERQLALIAAMTGDHREYDDQYWVSAREIRRVLDGSAA